ncbi:MAG TPA: hypothetical protein DCQ31_10200 [Bacteroidales bacterium]|nr:hypothetical protein [Bacteroidales bacterium]
MLFLFGSCSNLKINIEKWNLLH